MPAHFGLDISASSIKVVEAQLVKEGFELTAFGEVKTPASLLTNNIQDEEMIARALKQLLVDSKIRNRDVYITLPESQVYTRVIELPVLTDKELSNAVKFESEQYIPVPLEEVYLEYQVLYMPPVGISQAKMEVLLIGAKKHVVEKLVRIVQMAELTPLVIETSLLASMRVLKSQLSEYSLLVETGESSTDIAIIQHGNLKQSSSLPTAGQALTRVIAQNLSLSEQQAKQYKHAYGLEKDQLEGKIALAMKEPMTNILNHIIKNIRFAKSLGKEGRIEQIVLSGGTALLPGLTAYLVDQLNVEVNLANPFQNCLNRNLPHQLIAAGPRFASVIGLAIRE
jgi:type IV pilus assembly protein PilM